MSGPAKAPAIAALVDNPHSFRGPYPVATVRPILAAAGWRLVVYARSPGVSTDATVGQAIAEGANLVISAGGDGTLRDVAAALAGSGIPLGVLPGGTANVFAAEAGIPTDPAAAARALVAGRVRPFDLGALSVGGRGIRFLLFAGAGLDAAALHATDPTLKRKSGPAAIALGGAIALAGGKSRLVRVSTAAGVIFEGRIWQALCANTALYGGAIRPSPDARPDDGLLDLCLVPDAGPIAMAKLGLSLALHQVPGRADVVAARARVFELAYLDGPLPALEIDGTPVRPQAGTSLRFSVAPRAVRIRLPLAAFGGSSQPSSQAGRSESR
jgi:diacylglycerol kinase family enzyme